MTTKPSEAVRRALERAAERAQRVAEGDAGLRTDVPPIPTNNIDDAVTKAMDKARPVDINVNQ